MSLSLSLSVPLLETQGGSVLQGPPRDDGADRPEEAAAVGSPDAGPEPRRQETYHRQTGLGQRVRTHNQTQHQEMWRDEKARNCFCCPTIVQNPKTLHLLSDKRERTAEQQKNLTFQKLESDKLEN